MDKFDRIIRVGTVARLIIDNGFCGGKGSFAVCYETYTLNSNDGYSFIFKNGNYTGFSNSEIKEWLQIIGHINFSYNFTNVMKLSNDFNDGLFDDVFNKIKDNITNNLAPIGVRIRE